MFILDWGSTLRISCQPNYGQAGNPDKENPCSLITPEQYDS